MLIGELAQKSGVSRDTVRYYEKFGLIRSTSRFDNNYKIFSENTVFLIRFIRVCQGLGFTLNEIRSDLMNFLENDGSFLDVEDIVEKKIGEIRIKINELREVSERLKGIYNNCPKHSSIREYMFGCEALELK